MDIDVSVVGKPGSHSHIALDLPPGMTVGDLTWVMSWIKADTLMTCPCKEREGPRLRYSANDPLVPGTNYIARLWQQPNRRNQG